MQRWRTIRTSKPAGGTKSRSLRAKLIAWSILLFAGAGLCALTPRLFAQDTESLSQRREPRAYFAKKPLAGVSHRTIRALVQASATIPFWDYSITSPVDGQVYSGMMVGRSPFFHGARTTNITAVIVPLIMRFSDGTVFDPTATDNNCSPAGTPVNLTQNSPIFTALDIRMGGVDMGVTQYTDAFQRGNFWGANVSATGNRYHTVLSPVIVTSAQTATAPSANGAVFSTSPYGGCGGIIGVVNFGWLDSVVTGTIIPSLAAQGVGPTTFPVILLKDVVMTQGTPSFPSNCCIIGYHGAYGPPVQTYTPVEYDTTGIFRGLSTITALSHEVGEWMDDPTGSNPAPLWGHTGQVSGCQNDVEVGDPLSGTEFPGLTAANGVTYRPQELAFFSWFFRLVPSLGVNDWYSDNGSFSQDAGPVCN
jgi:hypothetical protein